MQNEAMGSPSFPNSHPRGVRIGALCRQLSQDQALCQNCRAEDCMRNEAESTSGICHLLVFAFLPPYGLPFLPSFSILLSGKKKKKKTHTKQLPLQILKSKRVPEKHLSISALLTMPKPLTVWITINCGKF